VDSDWGRDETDRKSTIGFCFQGYGCTVSWCTKKQPCVASSSTEAEYAALCACVCEACWFRHILIDLGVVEDINLCVSIFQSAIKISRSCEQPKRL
jgi:hypothetical protein